jgi:hypothetical protein
MNNTFYDFGAGETIACCVGIFAVVWGIFWVTSLVGIAWCVTAVAVLLIGRFLLSVIIRE